MQIASQEVVGHLDTRYAEQNERASSGAASCDMVEGQTSMPTVSDEDSRSIQRLGCDLWGKGLRPRKVRRRGSK